jgi:hypothetical protein
MSDGGRGAHTTGRCSLGVAHATLWCARLLALRLSFGPRLLDSKIGTLAFVSSNSRIIPM